MASAGEMLGGARASTASERLASNGKPSGKQGSPALTVKLRTKFTEYRSENPESDASWEQWLEQNGYGLGDDNHVYKK